MVPEISDHSKEVAKGSFWSLAGSVLLKLVSFFYVILIARAASQDDIGLFYLALGIVSLIGVFSHFGLPASLVRFIPYFQGRGEYGKIKHLLSLSYTVLGATGLIFTAALFLAADMIGQIYSNPALAEAIRMFSAFLFLNNIMNINSSFLQGRASMKSMQFIQNLQNLLKLGLTLAFFYLFGASVMTLVAAFLGSQIIAILASIPVIRRQTKHIPEDGGGIPQEQMLKEILPFGLMLSVVSGFAVIVSSSDRLLLGYLTEPSEATAVIAVYAIATTLATVLMIFPASIGNIFLPVMSRLAGKDDKESMRAVTYTAQRWAMFITIPIGIVMMAFSSDMLSIFYGQDYRSGALVMSIYTLGLLARSFSMMLSLALASLRMVKIELKISFVAALINIILTALLIPSFGMEGAAAGSSLSIFLMISLFYFYSRRLFGYKVPASLLKMAGAGAAAFIIILLLRPMASSLVPVLPDLGGELGAYAPKVVYLAFLGILISVSVLLFAAFSLLLRCFVPEDIALMRKVLSKANMPAFIIIIAERVASYGLPRQG